MHWRTDDVFAGLIFLAISVLFATTALRTLEIGNPGLMGPGFFPLMISVALAGLSAVIIGGARSSEPDAKRKPIPWRAVVCIIGSAIAFAMTVRNVGLVPALVISISLAVLASRKATFVRGAMIVVGSYGIGLTVELFASEFWRWR
jgi:hypothetical protein